MPLPYQERRRSRVEQIQIEQMLARGEVTRCRTDHPNEARSPRYGGALPAALNPVAMGERAERTTQQLVAEYEADSRVRRRQFEAAMRTPAGGVHE